MEFTKTYLFIKSYGSLSYSSNTVILELIVNFYENYCKLSIYLNVFDIVTIKYEIPQKTCRSTNIS